MSDLVVVDPNQHYLVPEKFEHVQRVAAVFAASSIVPVHFQGKPANCIIAVQMAFRLKIDPMMALQHMYVVKGTPSMSAQLAISLVNSAKRFSKPITYDIQQEKGDMVVIARSDMGGEPISATARYSQLRKDTEAWKTAPEQMLCYRAAAYLIKRHAPEVLLGLAIREEYDGVDAGEGVEVVAGSGAHIALEKAIERSIAADEIKPIEPTAVQRPEITTAQVEPPVRRGPGRPPKVVAPVPSPGVPQVSSESPKTEIPSDEEIPF